MIGFLIHIIVNYEFAVGLPVLGFSITQIATGFHGMQLSDGTRYTITAVQLPVLSYYGLKADSYKSGKKAVRLQVEYSNFNGDITKRDSRTKTESQDFTTLRWTFYFFPERLFNIGIRVSKLQLVGAIKSRGDVLIAREYLKEVTHAEAIFRFRLPPVYNIGLFLQKGYDIGVSGRLGIKTFEMFRDLKIDDFKYYSSSLGAGLEYRFKGVTLSILYESMEFLLPVDIENCSIQYNSLDKFRYKIISGGIGYAF